MSTIVHAESALLNTIVSPVYKCRRCGEVIVNHADELRMDTLGAGQMEVIQEWIGGSHLPIMQLHGCVDGDTYGLVDLVGFTVRHPDDAS